MSNELLDEPGAKFETLPHDGVEESNKNASNIPSPYEYCKRNLLKPTFSVNLPLPTMKTLLPTALFLIPALPALAQDAVSQEGYRQLEDSCGTFRAYEQREKG